MVKVKFWLLDINPRIEEGKPVELWLWGIDTHENRVLVVDRNFAAYFFVIVNEEFDPSLIAKEISELYQASILKTEVLERRFFGKIVRAIKVYCKIATETGKLARQLRELEAVKECLEDDIRIPMQYLIDNDMVPCAWHEVEAEEERNQSNLRVDKVYGACSAPKQLESVDKPTLRTLSFSMVSYSREGSPKPDRNPVVIISTVSSNGEEKHFCVEKNKDDKALIHQFVEYVRRFDPDIILSFGGNSKYWDYLTKRCHRLQRTFDVDRAKKEPHTSVYGHVSFIGVANVDLADFMDVFPEVKVQTLTNLADHLGAQKNISSSEIEDVEFADYWDDPQKREQLKQFSLNNARKIQASAVLLLDFAMQLSSLVSLPLDHVMTAAVGFRVEWFLIKQTRKIGELVPRRIEQPYHPYAGGLVLQPKPGLHDDIAVLDFKSMYPNIMIRYNLSPDTYLQPEAPEPKGGVYVAPEVNHRFRKEPPGFYKEALTFLIKVRSQIRVKMKALHPGTVEYSVLDARQKAVKVITNAAYGYAGWIGARWYIKPVAEAASAWGRFSILSAVRLVESKGLTIIYGDTDSLFLTNNEKKILELQKEIGEELGLEAEVSEVYMRIFFTEAKKRYAGLRADGSLDIVGLEVIRGDWAQVAKNVQENVLGIILREKSPEKAVDYVHKVVAELRNRQIPFHDLIIWKTLTKPPEQYAIRSPHVEAAKMLKEKGWRLTGGDKVGFVILAGTGRFYNRVKPYVFAKYDEVDVDYYINNQVVPAAARILSFFKVTEEELMRNESSERQQSRSLTDYL
ncbi:MAG: DNA polymerase domain-containing protein [Candidatus Bathyarchaeia archaeon]|jgi:DNA polymerase I